MEVFHAKHQNTLKTYFYNARSSPAHFSIKSMLYSYIVFFLFYFSYNLSLFKHEKLLNGCYKQIIEVFAAICLRKFYE